MQLKGRQVQPHEAFQTDGVALFPPELSVQDWVEATFQIARDIANSPKAKADWLRCGGTWFAGVNILPNDPNGAVDGGPELSCEALRFASELCGYMPDLEPAQISITYPGYPKPMDGESEGAFRYRKSRDAAHVDGLLPIGPDKRRYLREPHAFVLGVPLTDTDPGASPMVYWKGSHRILGAAFADAFAGKTPNEWPDIDLTEIYQSARKTCFEECERVALHAKPGESYLVHRHMLHGVAPWEPGANAPPEGRMIAYFRPELPDFAAWLRDWAKN